jgi:hypothetical protein
MLAPPKAAFVLEVQHCHARQLHQLGVGARSAQRVEQPHSEHAQHAETSTVRVVQVRLIRVFTLIAPPS